MIELNIVTSFLFGFSLFPITTLVLMFAFWEKPPEGFIKIIIRLSVLLGVIFSMIFYYKGGL